MFLFSKGVGALYLVFHWSFIRLSSSVVASSFLKLSAAAEGLENALKTKPPTFSASQQTS